MSVNIICADKKDMPTIYETLKQNYKPLQGYACLGIMHGAIKLQSPTIFKLGLSNFPYNIPDSIVDAATSQADTVMTEYPNKEALFVRSGLYAFGAAAAGFLTFPKTTGKATSSVIGQTIHNLAHGAIRASSGVAAIALLYLAYETYITQVSNYEEGKKQSIKNCQDIVQQLEQRLNPDEHQGLPKNSIVFK